MARKNKSATVARSVEALIDPAFETATHAAAIDHVSQLGSWTAPDENVEDETTEEFFERLGDDVDADHAPRLTDDQLDALAETEIAEAVTVQDLEATVAAIEASEEVEEVEAIEAPKTYDELLADIEPAMVDTMVFAIADEIDERVNFEDQKNPDNKSIFSTLKKVRSQLVTKRAARVLIVAGQSPRFVNRTLHEGSRYNVYALGKLGDIVVALTGGELSNAINIACMKSLFRFRAAGVPFTLDMAKAACSKQIRVESVVAQHLIRHTVSPSTAPTQASSTMQALETLGVVTRSGSTRNPLFTVTDHPVTAKLERILMAA